AAFEAEAGGDLTAFWQKYVAGSDEIDFGGYLAKMGLTLTKEYVKDTPYANNETRKPGTLGIRTRVNGDRAIVANVLVGLPAYEGGVNANDELVAIGGLKIDAGNRDKLLNDLYAGQKTTLTVFRRERIVTIDLTAAPKPFDNYVIAESKDATDAQ